MKTPFRIMYAAIKSMLLITCVAALSPQIANAASYYNDFSNTGSNTAFTTETTGGQWELIPPVTFGSYQNSSLVANTASSASVTVAGINGTSFTMSSQFTVTASTAPSASTSFNTLGFGLMGADATFSTGYYLADFSYAYGSSSSSKGVLRILSIGDGSGDFSATDSSGNFDGNTTNLAIELNTTYTLSLTGTYNGSGHLALNFGLFDSTGTIQYGTFAMATDTTPLLGTNYGYRNRVASGAALDASFNNFALANVPEPSSALLGLSGVLALMLRRRR